MDTLQYERERITLGDELRTLRKSKNVKGIVLAKQTRISQSKLSKIETGALVPSTEDLLRIFGVLKPPRSDAKRLIEWAQALRTEYVSWRFGHRKGFGASQIEVAKIEQRAARIRVFQTALIPGLLQIPPYARHVVTLSNVTQQPDLERAISLRIRRQQILYEPERKFEFLITESAALSRFCDPPVVIQQLDRLRFLFGLPNITIGFISNEAALPRIPLNSFVVVDSSTATVETITGEVSTVDERDISTYNHIFDEFTSLAIFGAEADAFLERCKRMLSTLISNNNLGVIHNAAD